MYLGRVYLRVVPYIKHSKSHFVGSQSDHKYIHIFTSLNKSQVFYERLYKNDVKNIAMCQNYKENIYCIKHESIVRNNLFILWYPKYFKPEWGELRTMKIVIKSERYNICCSVKAYLKEKVEIFIPRINEKLIIARKRNKSAIKATTILIWREEPAANKGHRIITGA